MDINKHEDDHKKPQGRADCKHGFELVLQRSIGVLMEIERGVPGEMSRYEAMAKGEIVNSVHGIIELSEKALLLVRGSKSIRHRA